MGKDVPIAGSEADQDLEPEFTYTDLLQELGQYVIGRRQAGDVSLQDIMTEFSLTKEQAQNVQDKAVRSGKFEKVKVYDDGRRIVVLRKKEA